MRNLVTLLLCCALLPLVACDSTGPLDKVALPGPGPTGLDEQQFADVPAPDAFVLVRNRSFSHRSGELRMGRFVYDGRRLSPAAAVRYYRKEMPRPLYGWNLVDSTGDVATFRKGRDEARVRSEARGDRTRITVDVNYREDAARTQP